MIAYRWTGESFEPLPRFRKECDKEFVIGQIYDLEPVAERSTASHRHYFATVHEAWANLPEKYNEQFPSSESLRKYCLIKAGFYHSDAITCSSKAEAARLAAFVRPTDPFALVTVMGSTVTRYVAQSQSMKAMGKDTFQDSKTKVLEILAEMTGTTPDQLAKNSDHA